MKISNLFVIVFSGMIIFSSCKPAKERAEIKIKDLEKEVFSDTTGKVDAAKTNELVNLYQKYYRKYPTDTIAPAYIYNVATILMNTGKAQLAADWLDTLLTKYPNNKRIPQSLFLKGFIYENYLSELGRAKDIYTEFLKRFPKSNLADDAQASIDNLGKTPEELMKSFEHKSDSTVSAKK
jgi:outer membrane protein assembly factor BamD (BamD/ComL family)